MVADRALREIFHFLFLERLLKTAPPKAFALKGGVNLRFFFRSPRYSEDMDLDVHGVPVHVLRETGYKLLSDKALLRALQSFGVRELRVNDPSKAKQTETTQRFRLRLVNAAGEELPTKVEFSRRGPGEGEVRSEPVNAELARQYQRLAFVSPHYSGASAALQKVQALATRKAPQTRDVFDLHILHRGGHVDPPKIAKALSHENMEKARENLMAFTFEDYRDQVLDYLDEAERPEYAPQARWNRLQEETLALLLDKS